MDVRRREARRKHDAVEAQIRTEIALGAANTPVGRARLETLRQRQREFGSVAQIHMPRLSPSA